VVAQTAANLAPGLDVYRQAGSFIDRCQLRPSR
jgi:hypothetical protein